MKLIAELHPTEETAVLKGFERPVPFLRIAAP
jgi:hypothetical protein